MRLILLPEHMCVLHQVANVARPRALPLTKPVLAVPAGPLARVGAAFAVHFAFLFFQWYRLFCFGALPPARGTSRELTSFAPPFSGFVCCLPMSEVFQSLHDPAFGATMPAMGWGRLRRCWRSVHCHCSGNAFRSGAGTRGCARCGRRWVLWPALAVLADPLLELPGRLWSWHGAAHRTRFVPVERTAPVAVLVQVVPHHWGLRSCITLLALWELARHAPPDVRSALAL